MTMLGYQKDAIVPQLQDEFGPTPNHSGLVMAAAIAAAVLSVFGLIELARIMDITGDTSIILDVAVFLIPLAVGRSVLLVAESLQAVPDNWSDVRDHDLSDSIEKSPT